MLALLIMAGIGSIKVGEVRDVWEVSWLSRGVMLVTFAVTLVRVIVDDDDPYLSFFHKGT